MPGAGSNIYNSELQVNTQQNKKEERAEAQVLSDPFCTIPYEHQVRCSICPKSLSVQVNIKMFRNELLVTNKKLNEAKASLKNI